MRLSSNCDPTESSFSYSVLCVGGLESSDFDCFVPKLFENDLPSVEASQKQHRFIVRFVRTLF